jgi:hypothetical protein
VAGAGRPVPFEWLRIGDAGADVVQSDTHAALEGPIRDGGLLRIVANDDGATVVWEDDVISSFDRGVGLVAIAPDDTITGRWTFAASEPLEMPIAPLVLTVKAGSQPPPALPVSGELDVSGVNDTLFGDGWFPAEWSGTQRFRWATQTSILLLPVEGPKPLQLLFHLRAPIAATLLIGIDRR